LDSRKRTVKLAIDAALAALLVASPAGADPRPFSPARPGLGRPPSVRRPALDRCPRAPYACGRFPTAPRARLKAASVPRVSCQV
jgi:hypothetical protein